MRRALANLRLHHGFATEASAPARQVQVGFRSPNLDDNGANLASALATIAEIGDEPAFDEAIAQAFPGASIQIDRDSDGRFLLRWQQFGLLRPLSAAELSDGMLRYLCLLAALHAPRPAEVLAFNEPELSLYPDLLPTLAKEFRRASKISQIIVISHAQVLVNALEDFADATMVASERNYGRTGVAGQSILSKPAL